jgi:7-cyano-7-deazaguanine synthase in queuosine biosynthesis
MKNPIILYSGGVDSLAMIMKALSLGYNPLLLHIEYDHPAAEKELEIVKKIAAKFAGSCKLHLHKMEIIADALAIGAGKKGDRIIKGRNLMFISAALNISILGDYDQIWIGATKEDYAYWDCQIDFFNFLNLAIKEALIIRAPFILMTRKEVLEIIPESLRDSAWSCYEPIKNVPCGTCNSCIQ